ncbi:MAG: tRNA pseudouridine(55) synthase TruB [Bacteroidales bacterium]
MMDFSRPETFLEGAVLFIDKPKNWTSFDVVNKIRRLLRNFLDIKKIKVGHAGTLDPLATGLVIICTGKATKQMFRFQEMEKTYTARIRLGATTPSFDLETEIDATFPWEHITRQQVEEVLLQMTGEQDQLPPLYSAKSVDGKRAYVMARKGEQVALRPQHIHIYEMNLGDCQLPDLELEVRCSKGTYIRSLARDLGKKLGSGAHLTDLRRTRIGPHSVHESITIEKFTEKLELL